MKRKNRQMGMAILMVALVFAGCTEPEPGGELTAGTEPELGSSQPEYEGTGCVCIAKAEDGLPAGCKTSVEFSDGAPAYPERVLFYTTEPVQDFRFLELVDWVEENDELVLGIGRDLYTLAEFSPEQALVVTMEFEGVLPSRGIEYRTADGRELLYAVEMSGKGGSLLLTELEGC